MRITRIFPSNFSNNLLKNDHYNELLVENQLQSLGRRGGRNVFGGGMQRSQPEINRSQLLDDFRNNRLSFGVLKIKF